MRNPLIVLALAVPLALGAAVLASVKGQQGVEPRGFKPPRLAVVDISEVFDNYQKKKDVEGRLMEEGKAAEKKRRDLDGQLKSTTEELKNVQPGTEKELELVMKKTRLEYSLKKMDRDLLIEFKEKQFNALKEMKNEITADIQKYAESLEIDIVMEKKFTGEQQGDMRSVWPIVHYARPELDITADIVKRLNAQYRPAAGAAAPQATGGKK